MVTSFGYVHLSWSTAKMGDTPRRHLVGMPVTGQPQVRGKECRQHITPAPNAGATGTRLWSPGPASSGWRRSQKHPQMLHEHLRLMVMQVVPCPLDTHHLRPGEMPGAAILLRI